MALIHPRHARILALGVSGGADDDSIAEPVASGGDTTPDPAPVDGPKIGDTRPAPEATKPEPSEYEKQLRSEVAGYRKRFEPYERALGSLDDDTRAGILELASLAAQSDDASVRARVAEVFGLQLPPDAVNPAETPMTKAEFTAWQQAQTEQAQAEEHLNGLIGEAKSHGIEHGTPAWYSMIGLLQDSFTRAAQDPAHEPLTVEAAVKQMFDGLDAYGQSRVDEYASSKGGPKPAVAGAAPEGAGEITTFQDATKAALAAVSARPT